MNRCTHGLHVLQLLGVHLHPRLLQGVHEGDQLIKPQTLYTKTSLHGYTDKKKKKIPHIKGN
jgi:hypothetical protein